MARQLRPSSSRRRPSLLVARPEGSGEEEAAGGSGLPRGHAFGNKDRIDIRLWVKRGDELESRRHRVESEGLLVGAAGLEPATLSLEDRS